MNILILYTILSSGLTLDRLPIVRVMSPPIIETNQCTIWNLDIDAEKERKEIMALEIWPKNLVKFYALFTST
jgi:hypothetical protein